MTHIARISIIIPAHNAAHYLQRSLPALYHTLPASSEVIVVNDASTDDTATVAAKHGAAVVNLQRQSGPSAARNEGVSKCKSETIIFLDADIEVHADTVQLLFDSLDTHPEYAAVFGSYDADPADRHLVSSFKNLMHHHVHQTGSSNAQTFWTGCGAIRRSVFQAIGPFQNVGLTCVEDIDYGHRLCDAGYRIWLRPEIECKHLKRWTLATLIKTDIFHRGIPWTVMMLRRGKIDSDLNVSSSHRFSAFFALATVGSIATLPFVGFMATVPATVCLAGLLILQHSFYQTLYRHRGWAFAMASIPLHLLYYLYSLVALAAGLFVHTFSLSKRPTLPIR